VVLRFVVFFLAVVRFTGRLRVIRFLGFDFVRTIFTFSW
jgi:hypothetical protein